MKLDATVLIFAVVLGFVLINSQWFREELSLMTDIIGQGIKEIQNPS